MYTVLIVMVVYIHSYYLEAQQYNVALFLQNFTGTKGVGRTANYLFSVYLDIYLLVTLKTSMMFGQR